jgi:integrase
MATRRNGQITPRGDRKWLVRVYLGTDAEGKRRYHSKIIHGNKRDATTYLNEQETARDTGTVPVGDARTVGHYLNDWIRTSVKPRLRHRTATDYGEAVRLYIKPALGARFLKSLDAPVVRGMYAEMRERGLSPRTIRKAHAVLHAALEQALRDRLVRTNVAHLAKDALPPREHKERKVLTPEEAGRLVEALERDELGVYWLLLLTSGLRPAEALALRWSDLHGDRLHVQRAAVERKGSIRFEEPKTSKSRRAVPLPASTVRALREHRKRQAAARLAAGGAWADQGLIFATRSGGPYRQSFLQAKFKAVLLAAELPPMRTYDLRHSCATLLLAAGESPKVVADRLGHSSVTLTLDTYSHVLPDMQRAATAKLERLVFGGDRKFRNTLAHHQGREGPSGAKDRTA